MPSKSSKLEWIIASLQEDLNWWVVEVSEDIPWDLDGLGIIDPKQWSYMVDLLDPLREYGLDTDVVEAAFLPYSIDKAMGDQKIRLLKSTESVLETEETLFVLPDVVDDDETGPYADFLDHITQVRVKLLNDLIDFEKSMTPSELEEDLRDELNNMHFEGKNLHYFTEITAILDYTPAGYTLDEDDEDDDDKASDEEEEIVEDIPDLEEEEDVIPEDDTMKWDDEDEEEEDDDEDMDETTSPPDLDDEDDDDLDDLDDEEEEDDDEEEEDEEERN